jgi:guanylate kinase
MGRSLQRQFLRNFKSEVDRIWAKGKNVILILLLVDCESNLNFRWDTSRFVKPPSIDELKIRLKKLHWKWRQNQYANCKSICRTRNCTTIWCNYQNYDLDTALEEAHQLVKSLSK